MKISSECLFCDRHVKSPKEYCEFHETGESRQSPDFTKRQKLIALGQRAIDYYLDTGLCVFCQADDCQNIPHEDHCNVGELSDVIVNKQRKAMKAHQRALAYKFIRRNT